MRTPRINEKELERLGFTQARKNEVLRRDGFECRYCGSPAECVDHVSPASYSHDSRAENLVACCVWCNLKALDKVFDSFEEKREYLRGIMHKRRLGRRVPVWIADDMHRLGRTLKSAVESSAIVADNKEHAARIKEHIRALGMFPV